MIDEDARVVAVVVTYGPTPSTFLAMMCALSGQVDRILVVDNGRGKGLSSTAEARYERIDMNGNAGVAAAQNAGIARATALGASHVLLLDHDSVPGTGMVQKLVQASHALQQRGVRVAAVGAEYQDRRHRSPSPFVQVTWRGYRRLKPPAGREAEATRASFLISAGSLIGLDALTAVGPLNERLFIDYVDIEWCLRAASLGWQCFGVPGAMLEHRLGDEPLTWPISRAPIRFGGRTIPARSPLRHYYLFRNGIWLLLHSSMPLAWKVSEARRLVTCFGLFSLFAKGRAAQIRSMTRGVRDGFQGRMGEAGLCRGAGGRALR